MFRLSMLGPWLAAAVLMGAGEIPHPATPIPTASIDVVPLPDLVEIRESNRRRAREAERQSQTLFQGWGNLLMRVLDNGTSEERREALHIVEQGGLLSRLNSEHLVHFVRCASDSDSYVRATATRLAVQRWILAARVQHPEAIELALTMSHDASPEVATIAVCDGLAVVFVKSDDVLLRLMALEKQVTDTKLRRRIQWGLRTHNERVSELIALRKGTIASSGDDHATPDKS